jgi:hypothetical protein
MRSLKGLFRDVDRVYNSKYDFTSIGRKRKTPTAWNDWNTVADMLKKACLDIPPNNIPLIHTGTTR